MLTIKTKPDCTLGFMKITRETNSAIHGVGNKDLNINSVSIGKLSEITEEQARELMESDLYCGNVMNYKIYSEISGAPKINVSATLGERFILAFHSLRSAALSVGIEEKDFDKYLVIKL